MNYPPTLSWSLMSDDCHLDFATVDEDDGQAMRVTLGAANRQTPKQGAFWLDLTTAEATRLAHTLLLWARGYS